MRESQSICLGICARIISSFIREEKETSIPLFGGNIFCIHDVVCHTDRTPLHFSKRKDKTTVKTLYFNSTVKACAYRLCDKVGGLLCCKNIAVLYEMPIEAYERLYIDLDRFKVIIILIRNLSHLVEEYRCTFIRKKILHKQIILGQTAGFLSIRQFKRYRSIYNGLRCSFILFKRVSYL